MGDRPTAAELVEAVLEFLASEVLPNASDHRQKFRTLVAMNALGIALRELESTEELAGEVNYNYHKTRFGAEEAPGLSVFYKDEAGEIFHTYSTYARGLDPLVGTYQFLDLVPKGRDEDGLAFTMSWVRHHDKYGNDYVVW